MKCKARSKTGCLWGSHICGRPAGHSGSHRCLMATEGTLSKKRKGPCNFCWKNRKKAQ